jgi:hypothetical protein
MSRLNDGNVHSHEMFRMPCQIQQAVNKDEMYLNLG